MLDMMNLYVQTTGHGAIRQRSLAVVHGQTTSFSLFSQLIANLDFKFVAGCENIASLINFGTIDLDNCDLVAHCLSVDSILVIRSYVSLLKKHKGEIIRVRLSEIGLCSVV